MVEFFQSSARTVHRSKRPRLKSETTCRDKRKKKTNGKQFGVLFNEYWVGELIADWEKVAKTSSESSECGAELVELDTPYRGLTKNCEKSLIFALKPEQNDPQKSSAPSFSFRIVNQICADSVHIKRRIRRFQKLIPDYIEYQSGHKQPKKYRLKMEEW